MNNAKRFDQAAGGEVGFSPRESAIIEVIQAVFGKSIRLRDAQSEISRMMEQHFSSDTISQGTKTLQDQVTCVRNTGFEPVNRAASAVTFIQFMMHFYQDYDLRNRKTEYDVDNAPTDQLSYYAYSRLGDFVAREMDSVRTPQELDFMQTLYADALNATKAIDMSERAELLLLMKRKVSMCEKVLGRAQAYSDPDGEVDGTGLNAG
jgi:hypothetical protein